MHPLPSNFTIHIGNGKPEWFETEVGGGVPAHHFLERPVDWGFFLVVFCMYTLLRSAKEALGQWNTYQCACGPSSEWGLVWAYSIFDEGQSPETLAVLPWVSDYQLLSGLPHNISHVAFQMPDHWFEGRNNQLGSFIAWGWHLACWW